MVDVVRAAEPKRRITVVHIATSLVLLVAIVGISRLRPADPEITIDASMIDTVQHGVFLRSARAAGTLVPERIQWISTLSAGRVESIAVVPGQSVKQGAPLFRLTNPDVTLQVLQAERELGAAEAGLVTVRANLETQSLTQLATLASLRTTQAEAARQARAKTELARSNTIAPIELQQSEDQATELNERLAIEQKRKQVFESSARAQLDVQKGEIARLRSIVAFQRARNTALEVRAPVDGVVQDVIPEPGQWVDPGEVLAKIVSSDRLKAVLRVPEGEANGLAIGQQVSVDIRTGVMKGRVSRVDAGVQNGVVRVDVMLMGALPSGARPDLTVDGTVELERVANVIHVARPPHVQSSATSEVFRLSNDESEAERITIRTGRVSATEMEVVSGLKPGDVVLMIDPSDFEAARVRIKR